MYINRLIPCLLIKHRDLVKTVKYDKKRARYLGDPVNAVKIFNDREADEIMVLDITATKENKSPDFEYLKKITQQCFMPACYGGGVNNFEDAKTVFEIGFEKISLNTALYKNPQFIKQLVNEFGAQSIVGALDIKKNKTGSYEVWIEDGSICTKKTALDYIKYIESLGVGEVFINFMDNDGVMNGLDYNLISRISNITSIPIIVCGGAGSLDDCAKAIKNGAGAVACGSLFSFWGRNKAVLINYPSQEEINEIIKV